MKTALNLTLPWKVGTMGRRTTGHGESCPEVLLARGEGHGLIDIRVSSYYGTEQQVKEAADALCLMLNANLEVTYVR